MKLFYAMLVLLLSACNKQGLRVTGQEGQKTIATQRPAPKKPKDDYKIIAEIDDNSTWKIFGKEHTMIFMDSASVAELENKYGITPVGSHLYSDMFSHRDYPWVLTNLGQIDVPNQNTNLYSFMIRTQKMNQSIKKQ